KFDLEFEAELTASQRQALEQLKGEKIDLPPTLYDYSRGGGGRERGRSDRSRESQRNPPRPTADSPPSKSSAPKPPGPESSPEECTVTPQPQLVNSADE
ncbi:MAG: hypothetical protein KDA45_17355, partial [Planctomycetales bacterium]|nr:hypothetical protein [Planctomycetales bacterium]